MKTLLGTVGVVALIGAGIFGLESIGYLNYGFFLPWEQQIQYNTFKNSQAYNEGMMHHLYEIQRQYNAADAEGKASLRQMVLHEFEVYDRNRLPADLQAFYNNLNGGM
jgi:hypothetical protein